jgi:protein TonB
MDTGTRPFGSLETRRRYRAPVGIPAREEPRWKAAWASLGLHVLAILLVVTAPSVFDSTSLLPALQGAGGRGPAGGGGGGAKGAPSGWGGLVTEPSAREHLTFLRVPEVNQLAAKPHSEPRHQEQPKIDLPSRSEVLPRPDSLATSDSAVHASGGGAGGGSGSDSSGAGPGRGGGVGSGVGTGRGSGVGPGTGGGEEIVYPPTVVSLPILPLPVPPKVRPYKMIAQFEVDTLGNARLIAFNPSRDEDYNRRIRAMLMEIRFRPAVRADGRPVKAIAIVTAEAM